MIRWFITLLLICYASIAAAQNTVTPQIGGGISYGFDGGVSFNGIVININCPQGATYIAALTSPTPTEQTAFKTAICSMVAHGTFALLDALYIEANTSAANAKVNAVNPGTFNLVQTGSLTFTADQGFTGDGSTGFLDTGFTPSTAGGHMALNSTGFGFCALNNRTTANNSVGFGAFNSGSGIGSYFLTLFSAPVKNGGAINDAGSDLVNPGAATTQGSWAFTRTASNVSKIYHNGAGLSTNQGAGSVSLTDRSIYEFARNDTAGPSSFTTDQHAYFFMGAGLTDAQVLSIHNDLGAMLWTLGIVTPCAVAPPVGSLQNYFFDSVAGADTNNCLAASGTPPVGPCLTITKANILKNQGGGSLTFSGSFTGCLVQSLSNVSNPSAGPITINLTGATLTSNCGGANVSTSGPKTAAILLDSINATLNGGTIRGSGFVAGSATQYGIAVQNSSQGPAVTYLIENTDISGFGVVGLTGSSDQGADIFMGGFSEAAGAPQGKCGNQTVNILNNTLHGSTATSGENNGFFGTGCGGTGQVQQVQGNLIFNISGIASNPGTGNGGYLAQGSTSSTGPGTNSYTKFTLAHDIGGNGTTCGGPVGLWVYQTYGALLTFDEVYNVQGASGFPGGGACDFSCYDFDINAWTGLAQYIYGHNCGGPGFVVYDAFTQDTIRYSIFENTASYNEDGGGSFSSGSGGTFGAPGQSFQAYNLTIFNNYVPGTSTPPSCLSMGFGNSYTGALWANNACYNAVKDTFNRTYMVQGNSAGGVNTITMKNNDYFNASGGTLTFAAQWPNPTTYAALSDLQTGTSQEANSKIITPGFTAPPSGTCTWTPSSQSTWPPSGCPSAYSTLAAGLVSAGANLASTDPVWFVAPQPTDAGQRDYYGNAIPGSGSCYNMGAYGVCP
jgi:hypothetical protein